MNNPHNHYFTAQKSKDILLDLFLEETLGEIGGQQDDWSDGITGLLQEDEAALDRKANWDYFSCVEQRRLFAKASSASSPANVVKFPVGQQKRLPLSA
jgi:hypothetical protein